MSKFKKFITWMTSLLLVLNLSFLPNLIKVEKAEAAEPATHLVISEIQVEGEVANDEFVELYNPTSSDKLMNHWRLTKKTSGGTEENLVSDLNGTVPAHGFFLITPQSGYNGTVSSDATYSQTSNFIAKNNSVLLKDDTAAVVDKVGFGEAADYETTPAPNPEANGSLERKPGFVYPDQGNGYDTDNNYNDFLLRSTSEPQNSQSDPEVPSLPAPVTDLQAQDKPNDEGGTIILTWTKSADDGSGANNVTGYHILRSTSSGGPYETIGAESKGGESFSDNTAILGITFYYKIETLNGQYSTLSSEVSGVSADNLAPRISNLTPADTSYTNNPRPTISATFVENGSGVDTSTISLTLDGNLVTPDSATTAGVSYRPSSDLSEGGHLLSLSVADKALNPNSATWSFIVDTQAPSGSITINGGASSTNSPSVTLTISATDLTSGVSEMILSNDGVFDEEVWEAFTSSRPWALSQGDGLKTVYLKLKDKAKNESSIYADDILLDTTPPNSPTNLKAEPGDKEVALSWDSVLGAVSYKVRYKEEGKDWTEPITLTSTSTKITGLKNGVKYYFQVASVDENGNISSYSEVLATPFASFAIVEGLGGPVEEVKPAPVTPLVPKVEAAPKIEEGKILGKEEEKKERNWTPIIVIGCLIILFGAAYGGWRWYSKRAPTSRW